MNPKAPEKKESVALNLILNIIIPTLIMTKFSDEAHLGPVRSILIALAFPLIYGIYDFIQRNKFNLFSLLGIVSVVLTGGITLLKLDPKYVAIKEAAVPAFIGVLTLISTFTRYPLVRVFLYNDAVIRTDYIAQELQARNNEAAFEQTLRFASMLVALSFFLSAVLNYVLAKWLVVSPPGTEAFAKELGKMTAYSYVVIVLPSMLFLMATLYYLVRQITRLTGLKFEQILHEPPKKNTD